MEVIHHAVPPDALLENTARAGSSQLFWVRSDAFAVRCEPSHDEAVLKLLTVSEGALTVCQHNRRATIEAGTFTWVHPDEPFELHCEGGRMLHLRIPRDLLERRHPGLDVRPALPRGNDHPGEHILAELLQHLAAERSLPEGTTQAALTTVLEALGLARHLQHDALEQKRVARALRDIDAHLAEPGLQPRDVAARQGVSRRYLDGLFQNVVGTTMAKHIRSRRLEGAASDLVAARHLLASEVAERWGFRDASHFSRVFRARFGVSPTHFRAHRPAQGH